ncbi:hypothetical protein N7491_004093 [Penicillium cf. griseofulvum]|uniref:RNase III domain-containing protein n=1 Tax=Penicillium cf. griseofulvum TaxID=2972120 RepID=A0A9W9MPW7_9EURO|nr:hypothetical protein N7472_001732 [Penicillium cf. griseofulvum]KAJ5441687.1 hypothetical protein N7491_004093 [Penicillium cf. griseofulvum]
MSDIAIGEARMLLDVSELPANLIREALTVAGADSKFPEGFKSLAQLGATYIDAAFQEMGYKGSLSRELISDVMGNYNTMKYRAVVARKLEIQHLIKYGINGKETEKTLSFAISALIATVHLTRGPDAVRACVIKLGFLDEGPGLQMRQKYEAVTVEHSVPITINQPSVTAPLVQIGTTRNEQSPSLPDQPNSQTEASSSENDSFHAATPETSLTSEYTGLIPFDLPRELDDLDLGNRGTDHFEDSQGVVETIHTSQIANAFNSEPQHIPHALPFFNSMPSFLENPDFSVQEEPLHGLNFYQRPIEVEDDIMALENEQSCIENLSDMARKRKAIDENYARKSKRVNTAVRPRWAVSLAKEMERCQSRKTRMPPDVFFREDIKARCAATGPRFSDLLTLILVQIADSSSFVCLRDAIRASKTPELDKPRKFSTQTSMGDRFNILERLDGEIAYNALLKRYHLLELFTNCGGNAGGEDMTVIPYAADNTTSQGGRRGNPIRIALAEVTQRMMTKAFPSLSPDTEEYQSRKRTMNRYRALASRFQALVDKFGRAILCFIQPCQGKSVSNWGISDNKIREISDISLKDFIEVLDQSQGDYLRSVCAGAEPLLKCLVYENSATAEFAIEHTEAADILQLPKGSDELLRLLQHTSEDGTASEIR